MGIFFLEKSNNLIFFEVPFLLVIEQGSNMSKDKSVMAGFALLAKHSSYSSMWVVAASYTRSSRSGLMSKFLGESRSSW